MNTRILDTSQADVWHRYLARLPDADVYHTPEYHRAHEANGDGRALAFVAEEGAEVLFHPFMLRPIFGTEYSDVETVYGYSGPLATTTHPASLGPMWWAFHDWCLEKRVVAEFIRFNPLSPGVRYSHCQYQTALDRETVVLGLSGAPDDLTARYTSRQRNMVRKAEGLGLVAGLEDSPAAWQLTRRCYENTMDRNAAAGYYHFSHAYWRALEEGRGWCRLLGVRDREIHGARFWLSGAVFLLHGDRMHYHLAGSDETARGTGAANLLLHAAALWGQAHGYRWLHLGGGRTSAPDDSLLRFKASVSRGRLPFHVGGRVHDPEAYRRLCDDWMKRHPGVERPNYFLLWRLP